MKAMRVVLAEDNAVVSLLLAEVLGEMGYEVCAVVGSEAETIAAAARHKPDLMIVDAGLGDGSGVAAITAILRNGPVAHLFISGTPVLPDRPDAMVLLKPFNQKALARAIAIATAGQLCNETQPLSRRVNG